LLEIYYGRCPIGQRLMRPLMIVDGQIARQSMPRLARAGVVVGIDLLKFD
jgi:hypothetical protein